MSLAESNLCVVVGDGLAGTTDTLNNGAEGTNKDGNFRETGVFEEGRGDFEAQSKKHAIFNCFNARSSNR